MDLSKIKHIGDTDVRGVRISTVRLPFIHIGGWYETLVFGGEMNDTMVRYNTVKEARKGHTAMVKLVRAT